MEPIDESAVTYFWKHFDESDATGCWTWNGYLDRHGYGRMRNHGRETGAHRISAAIHLGLDIKDRSVFVCHKCDNPSCVNPQHLFLGSARDNTRDSVAKGRWVHTRGELSGTSKLKAQDVLRIRELLAQGVSRAKVARAFGVTSANVSAIALRKSWAHLP